MKKLFVWTVSILLILLTIVYLAVNSSYVFEMAVKKFAPQFGFTYKKIGGNPLSGITIEGLDYKNETLADSIKLHINPYLLLKGNIGVNRLDLSGVDINVLEKIIADFSKMGKNDELSEEDSGTGTIPFGFELNKIHLSLKPFGMLGVDVDREELDIDYIIYNGSKFIVGDLKQNAKTSLGDVKLVGSYHKRVLDLSLLQIDELRVQALIDFIGRLSSSEGENSKESESKSSESKLPKDNIFIPVRILTDKLIFKMLPYKISGVDLYAVVLDGKDIDIDLKKMIFDKAKLQLKSQTNIGNVILKMDCIDDECIAEDLDIRRVNIENITALSKGEDGNDSNTKRDVNSSKPRQLIADIPFVPDIVDIKRGRVRLLSQTIAGIGYENVGIDIRDLAIDLRREFVTADKVDTHIDTVVGSSDINISIDRDEIVIDKLDINGVDIDKIISIADKQKSKKRPESIDDTNRSAESEKSVDIPYLPEKIIIDSAKISTKPYKNRDIDMNRADFAVKDAVADISKMRFENGRSILSVSTDMADINIEALLQGEGILIDADRSIIVLKKGLMNRYKIPLEASAVSPIKLAGSADKKSVIFDLFTKGKNIYADKNASFNVDLNRLAVSGEYDIDSSSLKSHITMLADLPKMIKGIKLNSDIGYSKESGVKYAGRVDISDVSQAPKELKSLIKGLNLEFEGDQQKLTARLNAAKIKGSIVSKDMKKAEVLLGTKGKLRLKQILSDLPKELKSGWIEVKVKSSIDLKKPLPIKLKVEERSNIANLDAKAVYEKEPDIDAVVKIPKNSLLNKFDKNLKLSGLSPLKISLKPKKDTLHLNIDSGVLKGITDFNTKSKSIKGKIRLSGTTADVRGKSDGDISISLSSSSLKKLIDDLSKVYKFESPNIDGDLRLKLTKQKDGIIKADISSGKFISNTKARVKNPVRNLKLALSADMKNKIFYINSYSLESAGMKFFAKKRAKIVMKKDDITVDKLWINDSMSIKGRFNTKKEEGKFDIKAGRFKVVHENAKIDISTDMKLKLSKGKVSVDGKVYILGGRVFYNLSAKHYASDEDIVIVQHLKEKKESFFVKNVKLNILIDSKKPLKFKQKDVYVSMKPSMSILKEYSSPIMVLGSIDLQKGGYYNFEGKKFVLEKSAIYFTGKANAPMLNIRLVYRRYGKTIWITISGTGTEPALNFSSSPYMTRDQILSFILFDTENSGNSTEDMLSLVGGGLAKSILGNMGLKIDTLVLSQNGFEVGKKITDKVSIIYDQEDESKVIVRIEHSPKVETEISVGQDSQSVDIIYKREY